MLWCRRVVAVGLLNQNEGEKIASVCCFNEMIFCVRLCVHGCLIEEVKKRLR